VFKNKALFVIAILVIAVAVIASSCAPAAPAEPAATPATPPAAPATPAAPEAPPAAPVAPAAPAAPLVTHTWGDSKTYTNDEVGFSVTYPAKWITKDPTGSQVFVATAGTDTTADTLYVNVIPAATDLPAAAKDLLDNSASFQQYKVKANVESSAPFKLASGSITDATAGVLSARIVIYTFYFYAIGATKGDKTVGVMGSTIGAGNAKKQIQEICQTLSFK
jgi:hypothetical protein